MNAFLKSTTILLAALPWQASRWVEAADSPPTRHNKARGIASVPPQTAGNNSTVGVTVQPNGDTTPASRAPGRLRLPMSATKSGNQAQQHNLVPANKPAISGIAKPNSPIDLQRQRGPFVGAKTPLIKVQEQPTIRRPHTKPGLSHAASELKLPKGVKPADIIVRKPKLPQSDKPVDLDRPASRLPQVDRKPAIKLPGKIKLPETVKLPDNLKSPKPHVIVKPVHGNRHDGPKSPLRVVDKHRLKDAKPLVPLADRLKRGDLHKIVDSKFGHQLELKKQFELHSQGDLGRRLNLQDTLVKRGGWQNRFCGPIDPLYSRHCINSSYCGPSWYPSACWFPQWCNWVNWCWNFNCLPICDPRPIYCRPICYDPCVAWVGWSYPVWTTLPVVTCGTWVDAPVVAVDAGYDMQLLAVRFVDPGHPEQNLGPRYRVWLRNNSPVDVVQPFNVLAYASTEREPGMGLPEAGVRVTKMDAGQIITVDLRLPAEANVLARDTEGRKVPFEFLHVVVDSHREIAEAFEANNGAVLDRRDILQIDPALFALETEETATGMVINLAGEGFGPEAGQVLLVLGGQEMQAEVVGWCDQGVQVRLPAMSLSADAPAELLVVRGDLAASNPLSVRLEAGTTTAALP